MERLKEGDVKKNMEIIEARLDKQETKIEEKQVMRELDENLQGAVQEGGVKEGKWIIEHWQS